MLSAVHFDGLNDALKPHVRERKVVEVAADGGGGEVEQPKKKRNRGLVFGEHVDADAG